LTALTSLIALLTLPAAVAGAAVPPKPVCPTFTEDQLAKIQADEIVVFSVKDEDTGRSTATAVAEIAASEADIYAILVSEEHSEAASKAMQKCTVNKDEQVAPGHRRLTVTYLMKVAYKDIQWTVNRDLYDGQGYLHFEIDDSYDNDFAYTQGYYALYPGSAAGRQIIVYVSNIDTGLKIPTWLEEDLTQGSLKKYLKYLKTAAEAEAN